MPYFDYEGDIEVDVDDFITACSTEEIQEVINALVKDGHLPKSVLKIKSYNFSTTESDFEDALNKLHGRSWALSKKDEETIIKISSRFT